MLLKRYFLYRDDSTKDVIFTEVDTYTQIHGGMTIESMFLENVITKMDNGNVHETWFFLKLLEMLQYIYKRYYEKLFLYQSFTHKKRSGVSVEVHSPKYLSLVVSNNTRWVSSYDILRKQRRFLNYQAQPRKDVISTSLTFAARLIPSHQGSTFSRLQWMKFISNTTCDLDVK